MLLSEDTGEAVLQRRHGLVPARRATTLLVTHEVEPALRETADERDRVLLALERVPLGADVGDRT